MLIYSNHAAKAPFRPSASTRVDALGLNGAQDAIVTFSTIIA